MHFAHFCRSKIAFFVSKRYSYFDMLLLTPKAHINLSWSNR